jgi:aspartate/methionine/tyrosine aminotransferase
MFISKRSAVEPFHAMDVLAKANRLKADGYPVISMAVGQPSDPVPERVRRAAERALATGRLGYTDSLGLPALRRAIAAHYLEHYGQSVEPERIAVTNGSSAAFNLAFLAMFDPGDRVAITRPGYPAYRNILQALGLEVVEIPVDEASGNLNALLLEAVHRETPLKGLLFASPANPTGATIAAEDLDLLVRKAEILGISVISDEIYHRLNYSGGDHTALAASANAVVINSFSKYYCMTGWRVGWMVLPEVLVRPVERLAQSLYICPPELSQYAAIAALECTSDYELIRGRYLENRALLAERLPRLGLPLAAPMDGAFYAWCDVTQHTNDSMTFANLLLEKTHVAATPGHDFDLRNGHRFMRFSYAGSYAEMVEALDRIYSFLR